MVHDVCAGFDSQFCRVHRVVCSAQQASLWCEANLLDSTRRHNDRGLRCNPYRTQTCDASSQLDRCSIPLFPRFGVVVRHISKTFGRSSRHFGLALVF